jgi:HK97 family phage prohead protease
MPRSESQPRREFRLAPNTEARVVRADDGPTRIVGHAAVFDSLSEDLGGFREKISPGAFAESIERDDIRALFNHDPHMVLGRNRNGSLSLKEDGRGLAYDVRTNGEDPDVPRVVAKVERQDVSQNSFSFLVEDREKDQEWDEDDEGNLIRTLLRVKLFDVGPVTFPAYPQTEAQVRSYLDVLNEGREILGKQPVDEADWRARLELLRHRQDLARLRL